MKHVIKVEHAIEVEHVRLYCDYTCTACTLHLTQRLSLITMSTLLSFGSPPLSSSICLSVHPRRKEIRDICLESIQYIPVHSVSVSTNLSMICHAK